MRHTTKGDDMSTDATSGPCVGEVLREVIKQRDDLREELKQARRPVIHREATAEAIAERVMLQRDIEALKDKLSHARAALFQSKRTLTRTKEHRRKAENQLERSEVARPSLEKQLADTQAKLGEAIVRHRTEIRKAHATLQEWKAAHAKALDEVVEWREAYQDR